MKYVSGQREDKKPHRTGWHVDHVCVGRQQTGKVHELQMFKLICCSVYNRRMLVHIQEVPATVPLPRPALSLLPLQSCPTPLALAVKLRGINGFKKSLNPVG